jgi:hypothetical protein
MLAAFRSINFEKEHPDARLPASKQTRKQLEQLFAGQGEGETSRIDLVKLAARLDLGRSAGRGSG